jgi:hypothetical protein
MADIIDFPSAKPRVSKDSAVRVKIIDQIATMPSHELDQAAALVDKNLSISWVNRFAAQGVTHTIGPTVYRRVVKNSRIIQADAVGVISEAWLECAFEAFECLRQQWGGRITLVWTLVTKRPAPPPSVSDSWSRLVEDGSPLERILIVDPHRIQSDKLPWFRIPEPLDVVHPNDLENIIEAIAAEHTMGQKL